MRADGTGGRGMADDKKDVPQPKLMRRAPKADSEAGARTRALARTSARAMG